MKRIASGLVLVAALLVACGGGSEGRGSDVVNQGRTVLSTTTNPSDQRVVLQEYAWVPVQEVTITVEGPGHVFVSATGGEVVREPSFGLPAYIGIGETGTTPPPVVSTVPASFMHEESYDTDTYHVWAYSTSYVYRVDKAGTYTYALYAMGSEDAGGRRVSLQPGSLVALFVPR